MVSAVSVKLSVDSNASSNEYDDYNDAADVNNYPDFGLKYAKVKHSTTNTITHEVDTFLFTI